VRARAPVIACGTFYTPLLLERSGGNPFFIEELVAFMLEAGDTTQIIDPAEEDFPFTGRARFEARYDYAVFNGLREDRRARDQVEHICRWRRGRVV